MENLTPEELRNICITILTAAGLLFHLSKKWKERKVQKKYKVTRGKKKLPPKKWTPDGWYFDEKKQKWVGPDFPQGER